MIIVELVIYTLILLAVLAWGIVIIRLLDVTKPGKNEDHFNPK